MVSLYRVEFYVSESNVSGSNNPPRDVLRELSKVGLTPLWWNRDLRDVEKYTAIYRGEAEDIPDIVVDAAYLMKRLGKRGYGDFCRVTEIDLPLLETGTGALGGGVIGAALGGRTGLILGGMIGTALGYALGIRRQAGKKGSINYPWPLRVAP